MADQRKQLIHRKMTYDIGITWAVTKHILLMCGACLKNVAHMINGTQNQQPNRAGNTTMVSYSTSHSGNTMPQQQDAMKHALKTTLSGIHIVVFALAPPALDMFLAAAAAHTEYAFLHWHTFIAM